jgi:DNA-binding FadR family transcriptional regulator
VTGIDDARAQIDFSRGGRRSGRPARLATVVVEELADRIIGGSFAEGDVLPTEDALCREFGFSRTVMREGLKLLEERGLIRVEQGRGTTVQPRVTWNLLDPDVLKVALQYDRNLILLDDLIAVRRLLEGEMARSAAARLSEPELAELSNHVDKMAEAINDYDEFRRHDLAFHATLMRASGSEIGRTIVRTIHLYAGGTPRLSRPGSRRSLKHTVQEHRDILEALATHDGDLAAERVAAHITSAWAERRVAATARHAT